MSCIADPTFSRDTALGHRKEQYMTATLTPELIGLPLTNRMQHFHRFSVDEYHQLIELGILTEDDDIELLDGLLVQKMSRNPPHDGTLNKVEKRLLRIIPTGWDTRVQMGITLSASEPEPDLAIVRDEPTGYTTRHPYPADIALLIEVSDSSLDTDREDKLPLYAQAGIAQYWIVNIPDMQIEVHTLPSGPSALPGYASQVVYRPGQLVSFDLAGQVIGPIAVVDLLP